MNIWQQIDKLRSSKFPYIQAFQLQTSTDAKVSPCAPAAVLCMCEQSCLTLCDPTDCSLPGSSVHGFPRQEYWSGLPFPPPGDLHDPGVKSASLGSPALAGELFYHCATWEIRVVLYYCTFQGTIL